MTQLDLQQLLTSLFDSPTWGRELINELFTQQIDSPNESFYDSEAACYFKQECSQVGVTFCVVASHGGEDQGAEYWTVYEFKTNSPEVGCIVKFNGSYSSYGGCQIDSWKFVKSIQKTITVYE